MLSVQEFRHLSENFVRTSSRIGDQWELASWTTDEGYLRQMCSSPYCPMLLQQVAGADSSSLAGGPQTGAQARLEEPGDDLGLADMELSDEEDANVAPSLAKLGGVRGEYHVLYSQAYAVPVLYFNVFHQDGKVLSLPQVWALCPASSKEFLDRNKWTTLTQQEHPVLGQPFLQLHPCHTASLMEQLTKTTPTTPAGPASKEELKNRNYLATWLSTVGPLVGLHISPKYIS